MTIFAYTLAGGAWIFAAFLLIFLVGVIYTLYTPSGSAITTRPYSKRYSGAPGASAPPNVTTIWSRSATGAAARADA